MPSFLAPAVLRYCGICLCEPNCTRGRSVEKGDFRHRALYRHYSTFCAVLAGFLTFFSFITLVLECADFQEVTDAFINFCSLYTTWVYIRAWRTRGSDLQSMLRTHQRFLDSYGRICRLDPVMDSFMHSLVRVDLLITLALLVTLVGLIVLVVLQSCYTLIPPLTPVPRVSYTPPPAEGETDPIADSRTLRLALILVFQSPALLCCGIPFAGLTAIHFSLNAHAYYLIRCIKRSLELTGNSKRILTQRGAVNEVIRQHQHVLNLIHTNNDIFARPMAERLIITYLLLGLTAYCLSANPFADIKVPVIGFFMVASLLQMAVLSDILRYECGSLQETVWQGNWTVGTRESLRKMVLLTARTQRYSRDGLAVAGMQDRISMLTFVQVMRSSVSLLQALRNFH